MKYHGHMVKEVIRCDDKRFMRLWVDGNVDSRDFRKLTGSSSIRVGSVAFLASI